MNVTHTKQTTLFDDWTLRHSNQVRNNKVKKIKEKYYREKADYRCQTWNISKKPTSTFQDSSFSAAFYAFLRCFSSSEFEARSPYSYSWTTNQPSLLRSAIFINFCLLRINCSASCTKVFTWLGSSALALILESRLCSLALNSNCFLLHLNLNSEADFCIWPSFSFPCS